jgi:hypothetical protein
MDQVRKGIRAGEDVWVPCLSARSSARELRASQDPAHRRMADEILRICTYEVPLAMAEAQLQNAEEERRKNPKIKTVFIPDCGRVELPLDVLREQHAGNAKVKELLAKHTELCPEAP